MARVLADLDIREPVPTEGHRAGGARPWLGVHFACAGAYLRVYRNASGTAYTARCPRCARCVRFRVGSGGSRDRFFEVSC